MDGLKCHQCTSFTDALCDDPFHYEPAREGEEKKPKTMEYYKDCPTDGNNYTICRKIYQNGGHSPYIRVSLEIAVSLVQETLKSVEK